MDRITIDADLPAKIQNLKHPAELVDAAGQVVAVAYPQYDPALYDIYGEEPSDEELDRRCRTEARIPAEEIIPRLRKLA